MASMAATTLGMGRARPGHRPVGGHRLAWRRGGCADGICGGIGFMRCAVGGICGESGGTGLSLIHVVGVQWCKLC